MNDKKYRVFRERLLQIFNWEGLSRNESSKERFFKEHTQKYLPNELKNYIYMAHECAYWVGKLDVDYAMSGTEQNGYRIVFWLENAMQPKKHSEYTQWLNLELNLMDLEPLPI